MLFSSFDEDVSACAVPVVACPAASHAKCEKEWDPVDNFVPFQKEIEEEMRWEGRGRSIIY